MSMWYKRSENFWVKKNDTLEIITNYDKYGSIESYSVEINVFESIRSDGKFIEKKFLSKQEALAYAKKYMRKHPNG